MAELDVIYDFETTLEESIRSSLLLEGFKAFTRLNACEDFQKDRPRVSIRIGIGAANNHYYLLSNGQQRLDQFAATITLLLVTSPSNVEADNVLHTQYRARVRSFMAILDKRSRQDFTNFPYHCFTRIFDSGTEHEVVVDSAVEITTLSYSAGFAIKEVAWNELAEEASAFGGGDIAEGDLRLQIVNGGRWRTIGTKNIPPQMSLDGMRVRFKALVGLQLEHPTTGLWHTLGVKGTPPQFSLSAIGEE